MKNLLKFCALASICLSSLPAHAEEVDSTPVTVTLTYDRPKGRDTSWNKQKALAIINDRLERKLPDGYGWVGVSKIPLKVSCPASRSFKGVPESGFAWAMERKPNGVEVYTGTITKIRCE